MRQVLSLIALCTISCALSGAVQQKNVTVGNQWLTGVSKSADTRLFSGLPFPARRAIGKVDTIGARTSARVIRIPVELGSVVEWGMYDVSGRLIEKGTAHVPEHGARDIRHSAAAGLYIVDLHSQRNPSVRRTMLIMVP